MSGGPYLQTFKNVTP